MKKENYKFVGTYIPANKLWHSYCENQERCKVLNCKIVSVAKIKQTIAKEFGTKTKPIIQEEIVWWNRSFEDGNDKIWITYSR